ncbi:protein CapL [Roseibium sp. TrichSKD4]|nr:protein CapL [Roseibium sp. TrichSKD4]
MSLSEKPKPALGIVGLGYVGLPVACSFAKAGYAVTGFDINRARLADLKSGKDKTGSVDNSDLESKTLSLTHDPSALKQCDIVIVAVPTPVDQAKRPDLSPFKGGCIRRWPELETGRDRCI